MFRRKLKDWWHGGSEIVFTVVQVVVFFLAFMMLLMWSFPKGSGLDNLYGELVRQRDRDAGLAVGGSGSAEIAEFIAVVAEVQRRVKTRPPNAIAWANADAGLALGDRHAVQTFDNSSAVIDFGAGNSLRMGASSVVVVKHPDRTRASRDRRASLVVLGGDVRGTFATEPGGKGIDIVTAQATTRVQGGDDEPASFAVSVNPDQSSTFAVYSGTAELDPEGRSMVIESNQAVTVAPDGTMSAPVTIPDPPRLVAPGAAERIVFGSAAGEVRFRWARTELAETYRLRIATDPDFLELLFDERLTENYFVHSGLNSGTYYWRVDAINGPTASAEGDVRSLEVVRDVEPPPLTVYLPEEVVEGDTLTVTGVTEPGAELLIGDQVVTPAPDGSFRLIVSLQPGPNLIVIESVDQAGNIAFHSQYVHAKFRERSR